MEVERLSANYDLDVRFVPYLLDPSTPPGGKPRPRAPGPDDPPSPLEQRGQSLGINFSRERTWTSNSHFALEADEFISENHPELANAFHHAMFSAYFEEALDIGTVDAVVGIAANAGVPADALRTALDEGHYREYVDEEVDSARRAGVTAVPTFIIDDKYAIVGAQPLEVFEDALGQLGKRRRM